ncbi:toxin-antitoxin system HicB family antitoxin [Erwinia sp. V90_4]|uniref:toxin-antitoxin system HicB family antitoxin n=1 Tax=Erwinia sp. V90_4 TaxID=3044239 RepID=UPI00249E17C5|nr:toxin-antitoxin system HicB family antitoxin [Erwinia sp. V90_4]MDI3441604.1 toxin-antitoxin system HicB family antitoxin [Erwinia sp. V90_4]
MKPIKHNPEEYTISVRKEVMDGMCLWVARVDELPDVLEFGENREDAYTNAIFTIKVGQDMCIAEGTPFPSPKIFKENDVSGRVTLRLKKTLHAQCIRLADLEGVSLNTFIASCLQAQSSLYGLSNIQTQLQDIATMVRGIRNDSNIQKTIYTQLAQQKSVTLRSRVTLQTEDDSEAISRVRNFCSVNVSRSHAND